jgi:hypothetical protein
MSPSFTTLSKYLFPDFQHSHRDGFSGMRNATTNVVDVIMGLGLSGWAFWGQRKIVLSSFKQL